MITITNAINIYVPTNDGKEIFVKSAKRVIISEGQINISKGKKVCAKPEKIVCPRDLKPFSGKESCLRIYNIPKNTCILKDLGDLFSVYENPSSFDFIEGQVTDKCFIGGNKVFLDRIIRFLERNNPYLIIIKS